MKLNQKVRVMRRLARRLIVEQEDIARDMDAFNAPTECWGAVEKQLEKKVRRAFDRLRLTPDTFGEEANRQMALEAEHMPIDMEPPMAYYETGEIFDRIEEDELRIEV